MSTLEHLLLWLGYAYLGFYSLLLPALARLAMRRAQDEQAAEERAAEEEAAARRLGALMHCLANEGQQLIYREVEQELAKLNDLHREPWQ